MNTSDRKACLSLLQANGFTDFMDGPEVAACLTTAREAGIATVEAWGGMAGAERRFLFDRQRVSAPQVCSTVRFEPEVDIAAVQTLLAAYGVTEAQIGDVQRVGGTLEAQVRLGREKALAPVQDDRIVAIDPCAQPVWKTIQRIAASMRTDALGAAAFNASRSWFSKGIAGGNVFIDGRQAGKASPVEVGSEIFARGLGRARLIEVGGQTKRGRTHVTFELESSG